MTDVGSEPMEDSVERVVQDQLLVSTPYVSPSYENWEGWIFLSGPRVQESLETLRTVRRWD